MKTTTFTLFLVTTFFFSSFAQDKAFEKGTICVDLGAGFAFFGTKSHNEYTTQYWTGSAIATKRVVQDTTDNAAYSIYPLSVEYGVTNWLGIGAKVAYANYVEDKDSITGVKPKATGFDAGLLFNLHLVKTKRFDMPIALNIGYSNFKIQSNDSAKTIAKDGGFTYGVSLVPRIYFGDHIGIYFNAGFVAYSYPSVVFSNNNDSNLNDDNNQDQEFSLKSNGGNLGIGLIVKF